MAQLWGGRFTKETDAKVYAFNASIGFDQRLYRQDIKGSIAHATMLQKQGIITEEEGAAIVKGLNSILEDVENGKLVIDSKYEDIHSFVEANLIERIGDAALYQGPGLRDGWIVEGAVRSYSTDDGGKYANLYAGFHTFAEGAAHHTGTSLRSLF